MRRKITINSIVSIPLLAFALGVHAEDSLQQINMQTSSSNTFYVDSTFDGAGKTSLLVDTGSGYTTINKDTLTQLQKTGDAVYLKNLEGIMADGSSMIVAVYRISGINLGESCYVPDIEVAVFPSGTREILGLNTLSKVSPFKFSMDPPSLSVSNCVSVTPPPKKVAELTQPKSVSVTSPPKKVVELTQPKPVSITPPPKKVVELTQPKPVSITPPPKKVAELAQPKLEGLPNR